MTTSPRRLSLVTGTALIGVALIFAILGSRGTSGDDSRRHASEAARRLESGTTLGLNGHDSTRALALAYVERSRLGLGNPFRLVEQAIRDPRLGDSTGDDVAWAILDRVFAHGTYEVDASVLDAVGSPGSGVDHLRLIDQVIASATDPRVGEATIRLAYGLASGSGTIRAGSLPAVIDVAAMLRDRALAERDLRRAVARAREGNAGLIDELIRERITRALDVERPLIGALSPRLQDDAIAGVSAVVSRIEGIRLGGVVAVPTNHSMLDARSAVIVSRLGARLPPVAATVVTLQMRGALLRSDSTLTPAMARFLLGATNEESLIAAFAYATHNAGRPSVGAARIMVSAAVALRALAQEAVWFPGDVEPSAGEIVGRYGLRAITFDADVPPVWHPYYVRMVESALDDLHRVLPAYEPTGLAIHIGMRALRDSALAIHDPRTHTLLLSAATAHSRAERKQPLLLQQRFG